MYSSHRRYQTSAWARDITTCRSFMRGLPVGIHSSAGSSSRSGGCGASQASSSRLKMTREYRRRREPSCASSSESTREVEEVAPALRLLHPALDRAKVWRCPHLRLKLLSAGLAHERAARASDEDVSLQRVDQHSPGDASTIWHGHPEIAAEGDGDTAVARS
eukprot:scaffold31088_cov75-Phaeocystis_antarctica.AAC.2